MSVTAPQKRTPTDNDRKRDADPYKDGMSDIEKRNYDNLLASPKGWSKDEARDMATNPSGRLPKIKGLGPTIPFADRAKRRYGDK